jgi:hypothetical protein
MFAKDPASFMRLLQCGQESIGTAAEDLATFLDITPYEKVLVTATCSVIGSSTGLTLKFVSSAASSGTSVVTAKDQAATPADLISTIGATVADGDTIALWVSTRGLLKWGSPQLTAAGAAMGVAYSIWGLFPRDTVELFAGWEDITTATNTAGNSCLRVAEAGSFAP